jgi:hypothetical protein
MPTEQDTAEQVIATAAFWSDIAPANPVAEALAAQLAGVQAGFQALRGQYGFEEEPAGFEAALQAVKDTGL